MAKDETQNNSAGISDRALEMVMRDVLDGLLEWSLVSAFGDSNGEFEIIAVGDFDESSGKRQSPYSSLPPRQPEENGSGDILYFPQKKRACN